MTRTPNVKLLLDAWREVGRHLELQEFVEALAPRMHTLLPFERLRVLRVDVERARLEVAAQVPPPLAGDSAPAYFPLPEADRVALSRWFRNPSCRVYGPAEHPARTLLAPDSDARYLLAGPLSQNTTMDSVGVLVSAECGDDPGEAVPLLDELLEPFAAAVANDARVHELARLREAVEADNRALLSRLERQDISDTVVGAATGLRGVMERVEQVARTDAPVLVLGETGSGKEVVARSIHNRSSRARAPFLRVNCGAIPSELVDSELFGHEKGSFTGAVATRKGWFERADGGTLFLDELGELPPAAQVRLLRVLQDGTFERVGGQRMLHADVRIVAATHREMPSMVADGRFRQDLWYRVSVFPIVLPPLRERQQDIAALALHFASRAGLRLRGIPLVPMEHDLELLRSYPWPGNVRELQAVIERAAILGDGARLDVIAALGGHARADTPTGGPSLDGTHRETIEDVLRRTRGRIEGPHGAAHVLGVNPSTLRSKMHRLGIEWRRFR
jgi:hydrogenase-4 transcriptional activator